MNLIDRIVQFRAEIQAIRRDIHAHPELAYQERRTSGKVERGSADATRRRRAGQVG